MESASIVFWSAASPEIGLGHLFRCLALAQELRGVAECSFFLSDVNARIEQVLRSEGFPYYFGGPRDFTTAFGQTSPNMLVIDSPFLPADAVVSIRKTITELAVVVLSDQSPTAPEADIVFEPHVVSEWRLPREISVQEIYQGTDYWILRRAFDQWLVQTREVSQNANRVLVSMGGTDFFKTTIPVTRILLSSLPQARIEVVCGPLFPYSGELTALAREAGSRLSVFRAPENMPELMWSADMAVTAAGYSAYEFAALGVPMILWPVEDHQHLTARALAERGCGVVADPDVLPHAITSLAGDASARKQMGQAGRVLVPGRGRERVTEILLRALAKRRTVAAEVQF